MSTAFRIVLTGDQEAPSVLSSATGLGTAIFDDATTSLFYSINIAGLDFGDLFDGGTDETADPDDNVLAAHIHNAPRGANGAVVWNLFTQDADDFMQSENADDTRSLTGNWETTDPATLAITNFSAMLANALPGSDIDLYFNVHTTGNTGGVIRGQFVAIADDNDNTITGTAGDDLLPGLGGNDIIDGGLGNDIINGGLGADEMRGGMGDDVYFVDDFGDTVIEAMDEGIDLVRVANSYTLPDNVENGEFLSPGVGGGLFGNELSNTLTGASLLAGQGGDDTLVGSIYDDTLNGGTGADQMSGRSGNDTYIVDSVSDVVIELAGAGVDRVRTAVSYTLSENVENADMLGSAAINLVGNSLANELSGNSASNILLGGGGNDFLSGGGGADVMRGGTGNDGYNVDNAGDVIIENAGEGTDLVRSTVNIVLAENVENVILGGPSNNPPEIFAAGNALDNSMVGNGADNILNGRAGADRMFGYGGDDTYVVDNAADLVGEVAGNGNDTVLTAVSRGILESNVEHLTMIGTGNINGSGNEDNNVIRGNDGINVLNGRDGNDTILAGLGRDTQYGGTGNDTFVFNSTAESGPSSLQRDRIADFTDGDRIYLLAIDADETTGGNQAFVLDTNGSFSAGEIRQTQFGSNLLLEMNTDADAAAEMSILLLNSEPLDAGDFVF